MVWLALALSATVFDLSGQLEPATRAGVYVFGASVPFHSYTYADSRGRFRFKRLQAGTYTLAIHVRGEGEARRTVEIGPSTANPRHRVELTLPLKELKFVSMAWRRNTVQVKQLAVTDHARREFASGLHDLEKHRTDSAISHLNRAVELSPEFALAWNTLGTLYFQTHNFARAEECFRQSLAEDPSLFEPLVNLGGVLVTIHKLDEALDINLKAVLTRSGDALANSQLGMTYFELGRYDLAEKYFVYARGIDAAHFSHPQLFLAEIHARLGKWEETAADLEDFLSHHPDWKAAEKMRRAIRDLRAGKGPELSRPPTTMAPVTPSPAPQTVSDTHK
jgi:tetratricopeptide (TPR) repeat protein